MRPVLASPANYCTADACRWRFLPALQPTRRCTIAAADLSPRSDYAPESKGCRGGMFGKRNAGNAMGLAACCDAHAQCYGTCGSGFQQCEEAFTSCLRDACEAEFEQGSDEDTECRTTAAAITMGTRMGGCKHYERAQAKACDCSQNGGPAKPQRSGSRKRSEAIKARRNARKAKRDEL